MKVFILGIRNMIGHVVALYFKERGHEVFGCDEDLQIQIPCRVREVNDYDVLEEELKNGGYDAVINCTAVINQNAENDKVEAIKINTLLPYFLEKVTKNTKTVVIHRSTDCIFSGLRGKYTVDDWPDAVSFYARSKALGELLNDKDITIRTSLIGPESEKEGTGLFHWFYSQKGELRGFANAIWTGITTIEYAREIEYLLEHKEHGLFQLVPEYAISKYELLCLFEKYYPANRKILRVHSEPVDKSLIQDKHGSNLIIPGYESMIAEMRQWTDKYSELYQYKTRNEERNQ